MDIDGIDVSIVYPTVGNTFYSIPDGELLNYIFRTYNDWVREFCGANPQRLKGIAMINLDDIDEGVNELQRCANLGFAGAMISVYPPEDRSYDRKEYEPVWAAAQDLRMPLSLHVGTNRPGPGQEFADLDSATSASLTNVDYWVRMSIANMIFSGVFERYPKLQIGSVEMELSWVPHFLDRLDYNYTQRAVDFSRWYRFEEGALPTDFFHRNVFLGFQEDGLGIRDRHIIGRRPASLGRRLPSPGVYFPQKQGDHRGNPGRLHRRREG